MLISASFLGIQKNRKENILKLGNSTVDFLHVDVMDGKFVSNKTEELESLKKVLPISTPFDVHLMVKDVIPYIEEYVTIYPRYITIHLEIEEVLKAIDFIKEKNIKVGLSIKPNTPISKLLPYLPLLDLVLVMSVEPGSGGQSFIESTANKINELKRIREIHNYHYLIEVDGGINEQTVSLCESADILVVGSYITNQEDYQEQVDRIKKMI